jgi:hypothetical protein
LAFSVFIVDRAHTWMFYCCGDEIRFDFISA